MRDMEEKEEGRKRVQGHGLEGRLKQNSCFASSKVLSSNASNEKKKGLN
jgi:hypothetical protein